MFQKRSLQTTNYKLRTSAFTLVEILVVMAVIAILATFVIRSFTGSKQKAQDARRLADIKNISVALERYYNQNDGYPTVITAGQPLKNPGGTVTYLSLVPTDPATGASYYYTSTGSSYSLAYYLAVGTGSGAGQAPGVYAATPGQVAVYQNACPATGSCMPAPCVPASCSGKICGSDGCSGTCGSGCQVGDSCSSDQTSCSPDSGTVLLLHMDGSNGGTTFSDSASGNKTVTNSSVTTNAYLDGTGGTITHAGGNTIHTFLVAQTGMAFTPPQAENVSALVVAGGGHGSGGTGGVNYGSGGAGGSVEYNAALAVTVQAYTITVGAAGGSSVFSSITATAGGTAGTGRTGASNAHYSGGTAPGENYSSGGGAGGGQNGNGGATCTGGNGYLSSISGTPTYYAGGGGGVKIQTGASGGLGGGGSGTNGGGGIANATDGTGGGGGGTSSGGGGGNGGSGTVIISYPTINAAKFGTTGAYFNGSAYLSLANSTDFAFGSGDFTIDFWLYSSGTDASGQGIFTRDAVNYNVGLFLTADNHLKFICIDTDGSTRWSFNSDAVMSSNAWHHVAVVRSGGSEMMFVDGIKQAATGSYAGAIGDPGVALLISSTRGSADRLKAGTYIDEFRVSKGAARWTSNFAVPTVAY